MRCCVAFCETTAEIVSESEDIAFHEFPEEESLCAAWLRVLGKEDIFLPKPAVVCSQHFLKDDFYETESGSRHLRTDAIPSTVQVCMICFDTHSKLFPMSKYNLEEAYEGLVGHALHNQGNLRQAVCVQCAQRLVNFSKFRDKSLRARALMIELVERHEQITIRHVKSISRAEHQLESCIVKTVSEPDRCDLYIAHCDAGGLSAPSATARVAPDEAVALNNELDMRTAPDTAANSVGGQPAPKPDHCNSYVAHCDAYLAHCDAYVAHCDEYVAHCDAYVAHCDAGGPTAPSAPAPVAPDEAVAVNSEPDVRTALDMAMNSAGGEPAPEPNHTDVYVAHCDAYLAHCDAYVAHCDEYVAHCDAYVAHCDAGGPTAPSAPAPVTPDEAVAVNSEPDVRTALDTTMNSAGGEPAPEPDHSDVYVAHCDAYLAHCDAYVAHCDEYVAHCDAYVAHCDAGGLTAPSAPAPVTPDEAVAVNSKPDVRTALDTAMNSAGGEPAPEPDHCDAYVAHCDTIRLTAPSAPAPVAPDETVAVNSEPDVRTALDTAANSAGGEPAPEPDHCDAYVAHCDTIRLTAPSAPAPVAPDEAVAVNSEPDVRTALDTAANSAGGESAPEPDHCDAYVAHCDAYLAHCDVYVAHCERYVAHCDAYVAHRDAGGPTAPSAPAPVAPDEAVNTAANSAGGEPAQKPMECESAPCSSISLSRDVDDGETRKPKSPERCGQTLVAAAAASPGARRDTEQRHTERADTTATVAPSGFATNHESKEQPTDTNNELNILCLAPNRIVEVARHPQDTGLKPEESLPKIGNTINCQTTRRSELGKKKKIDTDKNSQDTILGTQLGKPNDRKQFICDVCQKIFQKKCSLVTHLRTHFNIKTFTCKLCDYSCKKNSGLVKHMRTHTGEKLFTCKLCDNKYTVNSSLVRHMRSHTGEKPFACKFCDYKSTVNTTLVNHMRTHTSEKPFACDLCDYKCKVKCSLAKHMRTHTGEKPYACKLCKYKCNNSSHLVRHMIIHTDENPYACKLCKYKCKSNSRLVRHMRIHTGEKPFACKLCKYKCQENPQLVKHMRTHTREKPFVCKLCNYKCTQNSNLVTHMRTHTGEKPFGCKICDYKCTVKVTLVNHMKTHTGEKPYACKICNFKCTQNSNLITHMRTHTVEKPYTCKLCKYKCTANTLLVKHMGTHWRKASL